VGVAGPARVGGVLFFIFFFFFVFFFGGGGGGGRARRKIILKYPLCLPEGCAERVCAKNPNL